MTGYTANMPPTYLEASLTGLQAVGTIVGGIQIYVFSKDTVQLEWLPDESLVILTL